MVERGYRVCIALLLGLSCLYVQVLSGCSSTSKAKQGGPGSAEKSETGYAAVLSGAQRDSGFISVYSVKKPK